MVENTTYILIKNMANHNLKPGDLVTVDFWPFADPTTGIFVRDDTTTARYSVDGGVKLAPMAFVLYDGGIHSTPIDKLHLLQVNE